MQQIADWLEKLGMSEYAQRFAENDIDVAVLTRPDGSRTSKSLACPLGHRRKMMRAISRACRSPLRMCRSLGSGYRREAAQGTPPSAAKSR